MTGAGREQRAVSPWTVDELARTAAALDMWWDDPFPGKSQRHSLTYLERMHAALEAPTVDAALVAFGITQGNPELASPEQDVENRALMAEIRRELARQAGDASTPADEPDPTTWRDTK